MPNLIEQMDASAAERLVLPPGKLPSDDLPRFKRFLKVESHRIKLRHGAGASGREVCRARAALVDALLRAMWQAARNALSLQAQKEFPPLALVAIGGYGRGELNPHSDIDIMFLHAGQVVSAGTPLPHLAKMIDAIYLPLFDLGFKVGQCVRSVADCVEVANKDMQSKTSLIEARLIVGDARLFEKFQHALLTRCVEGRETDYIAARMQDQAARREKFGNSPTMQEPNLKNGCGGLRDFQNLHWMAFFKYRVRSMVEMEQRQFLSAAERRQLETAYDFLLRTRNELHNQAGRAVDVVTKSVQPALATGLGYTDRSPSVRLEKFMRVLYTHLRNIYLITRMLEERLALAPKPPRLAAIRSLFPMPFGKPRPEPVIDGFKFTADQVVASNSRVFRDQPRRLMRVFLHAQQRGLRLHPDLAQLIRHDLTLANRGFLRDEHVRESFLEILNQRGNVAATLRAMHEVGLLGKYVPEFGRLTCLVQHEFYHQYTADEHTLLCLGQLDRVWNATEPPHRTYAEVCHEVERPFVLHLALLLHDAGKAAHDGDHAEAGGQIALRVAQRLGLDGATTHALRLLIEQHLTMAQTSQRRDLDDPSVIRAFAAQVQSAENLRMLTLHTFADSMATSDKLWNGFKDTLLWTLHHKAMAILRGGTDFIRAEEKQRELLADEVSRAMPKSFTEEELSAHFGALPPRYFQVHPVREIVADMALAHRFMHQQLAEEEKALEPIITWHNEPDRGYTSVKVCTWNRAGLFAQLTGSFAAAGINILHAQIFSRHDGIVLDTFFVTDAHTGGLVGREPREKFEGIVTKTLAMEDVDLDALIARQKTGKPLYQPFEGERIPTRVAFDNTGDRTAIDVETEDRLGVLFTISKVLTDLGLDISLAKISTEKGAVMDTFYVGELGGAKIEHVERQKLIEEKLLAALAHD